MIDKIKFEPFSLYKMMVFSRFYEEAVEKLWDEGKIHGEMHMGMGEEAIVASILSLIIEGDAIASDHRSTPPFLLRGVDPKELLLEFLAHPHGLCGGMGGHMHLFSKKHLISSSGIVGSSGPAAAGYGLTLQYKKTNNISIAFFGEGAFNQGMLMESMNLASAWNLPVLFVCKDNNWAITTPSDSVTGGNLIDRARGFGIEAAEVDGLDVEEMWKIASFCISNIRKGKGPQFILAKCSHKTGHFLGDPLFRFHDDAIGEFKEVTPDLMKAMLKKGGDSRLKRTGNLKTILGLISKSRGQIKKKVDPIQLFEKKFKSEKAQLDTIKDEVASEVSKIVKECVLILEGGAQ